MNHRLGYRTDLDNQMDITEKFVFHSKNPNDFNANDALYEYYFYHFKVHYNFVKEVLIKNGKEDYLLFLKTDYDNITSNIFRDRENNISIDMIKIYDFFNMVSRYACLNFEGKPTYHYENILRGYSVYYVVENDAFYGLNTFLYAFFEGVFLLGVPTFEKLIVDGVELCPNQMLMHDIDHTSEYPMFNVYKNIRVKNMYYKIINDNNLDSHIKELLVNVLFIYVHELYNFNLDKINEIMLQELKFSVLSAHTASEILWKYFEIADNIPEKYSVGLKNYLNKFQAERLDKFLNEPELILVDVYTNRTVKIVDYIKCVSIVYYALNLMKAEYY